MMIDGNMCWGDGVCMDALDAMDAYACWFALRLGLRAFDCFLPGFLRFHRILSVHLLVPFSLRILEPKRCVSRSKLIGLCSSSFPNTRKQAEAFSMDKFSVFEFARCKLSYCQWCMIEVFRIYLHSIRCRLLGLFAGRCGASSAILSATAMPDTILDLLVLLVLFAVTLSLFSGLMLHRSRRSQWCESLSFLPLLNCSDVESIQTSDESISIVCLCPLVSNCLDFVPHFLSRSLSKTSFCQFWHAAFYKVLPDDMSPATKAVEAVFRSVERRQVMFPLLVLEAEREELQRLREEVREKVDFGFFLGWNDEWMINNAWWVQMLTCSV